MRGTITLPTTLERIARYRDRFSASGLIIGFLSILAAIWTTAPALDFNLPLVGGAKVGINVGYVMMAGMLILALPMAWLISPLLSMRRLQEAVIAEVGRGAVSLLEAQRYELVGPFKPAKKDGVWARGVYSFSIGVRYFVFFACPVLGIIWIGEAYFVQLRSYDRPAVIDALLSDAEQRKDPGRWRIEPKHVISLIDYFFRSKPYGENGERLTLYAIRNSDLERNCAQIWVRDKLRNEKLEGSPISFRKSVLLEDLENRTVNVKCVVDAFPRFELALNSWINLLSLAIALWVANTGWHLYCTRRLWKILADAERRGSETAAHTPQDEESGAL